MVSPLSAIESCLETGGFALLGADSEAKTQPFVHSLERGLGKLAAFKQSTHPVSETAVRSFCPSRIILRQLHPHIFRHIFPSHTTQPKCLHPSQRLKHLSY